MLQSFMRTFMTEMIMLKIILWSYSYPYDFFSKQTWNIIRTSIFYLKNCGLLVPYVIIDLDQHFLSNGLLPDDSKLSLEPMLTLAQNIPNYINCDNWAPFY